MICGPTDSLSIGRARKPFPPIDDCSEWVTVFQIFKKRDGGASVRKYMALAEKYTVRNLKVFKVIVVLRS